MFCVYLTCGNGFRGRSHTDEAKQKMSVVRKGRTHSEETKQKMRETHAQRKGISS